MDSRQDLQLPRHGQGLWPKGVKQPVPFRQEEAKVHFRRGGQSSGRVGQFWGEGWGVMKRGTLVRSGSDLIENGFQFGTFWQ